MILNEKIRDGILFLQAQYPEKRSALIPALHLAQTVKGYLPVEVQEEVADLFGIETSEVTAIVTFYDMFYEAPVGKHIIHACKNVSCMLRGADGVITKLCQKLNTSPRQVSPDGEFTVIPSECLGACDLAPMMIVDDKVVGPVKEEDLDRIIAEAKKGAGHPSPVELEDVSHA